MSALIVFAPQNYQESAEIVAEALQQSGCKVTVKAAAETMIPDLAAADLIVLGTLAEEAADEHTVVGTAVNSDFAELYRSLKGANLAGKTAGLFAETSASLDGLAKALADTDIGLDEQSRLIVPGVGGNFKTIAEWAKKLAAATEV